MYTFVQSHVGMYKQVCIYMLFMHGGQRSMPGVPPDYLLRQNLSQNMELTDFARLAGKWFPEIHVSPLTAEVTCAVFDMAMGAQLRFSLFSSKYLVSYLLLSRNSFSDERKIHL